MGVPLEERREGRTSRTPEFMDALESADTYGEAWGHPSSGDGDSSHPQLGLFANGRGRYRSSDAPSPAQSGRKATGGQKT